MRPLGTDVIKSDVVIDDLHESDLAEISWSGTKTHVQHVAKELKRVSSGDSEYIAVRNPKGQALAIGLIDHVRYEDASEIGQLSTDPALQGRGLGTILIEAAELRIRDRGHTWSILGVEVENVRARKLYERLGYSFYVQETDSWTAEDQDGNEYLHIADTVLLRKRVGA
jgi:ribosomal protein S18 acetylase RimI-like enzyme